MSVPYWVEDSVFYQIFPDRFANGDFSNDPPNVQPWDGQVNPRGFFGGDLRGIVQRFDYLLDLGINALYLNPIFLSSSTHRYNTIDYYQIDPRLGDMKDFQALLDVAHRNNVRVILDGVFNHCGRGFFAFDDLLENQDFSSYRDWFHVNRYPIDAFSPGEADTYQAWWGIKSLPKFNTQNPQVRRYIFDIARYWIERGADGWRLDVPNEIDDDVFWAEFRHVVRSANPDAYLVGEIWDGQPRWVGKNHFDGLMHYPLREATLGLVSGKHRVSTFAQRIDELLQLYARENVYSMYLLLGSHDTERILTLCDNDLQRVKLAYFVLFSMPGAPAIYYGDEVGLEGGKDPDCRRPFPWDERAWKPGMREWVRSLIAQRKRLAVLRRGDFRQAAVEDHGGCYAFTRSLGLDHLLGVLNASQRKHHIRLNVSELGWPDGQVLRDLLGGERYAVQEGCVELGLPALTGLWLYPQAS